MEHWTIGAENALTSHVPCDPAEFSCAARDLPNAREEFWEVRESAARAEGTRSQNADGAGRSNQGVFHRV
jgi:hypothetical protein